MPAPSHRPRWGTLALAAALCTAVITGCGGDEPRASLAINETTWTDAGLRVDTECAELTEPVTVEVGDDGIPIVTIWGSPRVGTCTTSAVVEVPEGTVKIVDAATSQVIDLGTP